MNVICVVRVLTRNICSLRAGHALSNTHERPRTATGSFWDASCGGDIKSNPTCEQSLQAFAVERIGAAIASYSLDNSTRYERLLSESVSAQVGAAFAYADGDVARALEISMEARQLEVAAVDVLLPTSTSLFFIPGTAFDGVLSLKVAERARTPNEKRALLTRASDAFQHCLSPQGRPNLPLCLIGGARAASGLGRHAEASTLYRTLLSTWKDSPAAAKVCAPAHHEAQRGSGKPDKIGPPLGRRLADHTAASAPVSTSYKPLIKSETENHEARPEQSADFFSRITTILGAASVGMLAGMAIGVRVQASLSSKRTEVNSIPYDI